jgi:UDP-glucose-4-epimerase GalE
VILVTGGAGYIGSHAVKALKAAGHAPVIFDNFSTGHEDFVGNTVCFRGDIRSAADLDAAFTGYAIEGVLHFAGKALVPESHQQPGLYYDVNLTGGLVLLEAMRRHAVKHIIFSSTCATYGVPDQTPIREDSAQKPINPYGESKLAFERVLHWFHDSHGMNYLSLRYFNAAGADSGGEFGEKHDPETHLIPLVLDVAGGRRPQVDIYGSDYPTADGTCVRDYIHVTDLAEAHVAGLEALLNGRIVSQALNLGTGNGYSVSEVIETARRITGRNIRAREAPRRAGDPPVLVAAVERARSALGWRAAQSDLPHIVATAWNWHQRRVLS